MGTVLDFDALDDVMLIASKGRPVSIALTAQELGPFIESRWMAISRADILSAIRVSGYEGMGRALRDRPAVWLSQDGQSGLITVRRQHSDTTNPIWVDFLLRLERGAVAAGFPRHEAKQLVGAVMELEDNMHWHSWAARTGLIAFVARPRALEIVLADNGIGMLASLRKNEEFAAAVRDEGDALLAGLSNGTSRFGLSSGRGWGFNELFVGLANANTRLRFRSGDHALTIDGIGPELPSARLAQKVHGRGLLVSVLCSPALCRGNLNNAEMHVELVRGS